MYVVFLVLLCYACACLAYVFICVCVVCVRRQAASIEGKIKKICDAFRARFYDLPDMEDAASVKRVMNENYIEMHDARIILLKVFAVLVWQLVQM